MNRLLHVRVLCCFSLLLGVQVPNGLCSATSPPFQRREQLLHMNPQGENVIEILGEALYDPNAVVRRTAVRLLTEQGARAEPLLTRAFQEGDLVVRRTALLGLLASENAYQEESIVGILRTALQDPEPLVRLAAVTHLAARSPVTQETERLLKLAENDQLDSIRALVTRTLWPFQRDKKSLRDRTDYDHDVTVLQSLPLPTKEWRFKLDPGRRGHLENWFDPQWEDEDWNTVSIGHAWQEEGYDYVGVAWYRSFFELPQKINHTAVDLHFKGVDESAWVWVNGVYVGEHDLGPTGWNLPFTLDVTEEVRWGEKNQITVRAMNTANAGGIWLPVFVEVLR